ncbi:hypothetical protein [Salinivibrio sp. PR919]|uniref:hypothetical protein n=1 Tax=Salinivibrio sp. PR919 TaxID=1909491 RepID=UPI0009863733|nr:hypothetical protein [Salinivibrio sp. PR919]OOF11760.1 hypothetical protein BZG83_12225 [Salinivibrio sp. PR919]
MTMHFELTKDDIEEIVCCIVDCQLSRDDACDYAIEVAREAMAARVESRSVEQLVNDGRNLIAEMLESGFKVLNAEILISAAKGVEFYREVEHVEANLMNRVFDEKGDFSLVERAAARKSC